jgi:hypothetical protein
MKTKAFKVFMLCAVMITASSVWLSAQEDDLKKMTGEWTYTMPDMGGGGSIDGSCKIATVNGETRATLSSPMGEITSTALKLENGKYAGKLDIPDFEMKIAFYFRENVLMQEIISDFGEMPAIEMKRAK